MSGYVSEEPRHWDDGFIEALGNPAHYRRTEMAVVDYSAAPPPADDLLPSLAGSPEPEPPSRWALLKAALRGGTA
jgi:hypothetical protein